jgi:hypothetical protein
MACERTNVNDILKLFAINKKLIHNGGLTYQLVITYRL